MLEAIQSVSAFDCQKARRTTRGAVSTGMKGTHVLGTKEGAFERSIAWWQGWGK